MIPTLTIPNRRMYASWEAWADAVAVAVAEYNTQMQAYLASL